MKKLCSICLMILVLGMVSGCAVQYPDTNTIYIKKNGSVQEASIESFDKSYYDEQGVKDYIASEISNYEDSYAKGSVKMKDFLLEDGVAKLMMNYDNYQSYKNFNKRELFTGTVVQAIAAGYNFEGTFEAADGKAAGAVSSTEGTENIGSAVQTVDKSTVTSDENYKVVVVNEDTDVVVKGTILYISSGSVSVKSTDTASVKMLDEGVSYIVYK